MTGISPQPRVRLSRLRDIGWSLWDPICLLGFSGKWEDEENKPFADEYDSYLISAASQLRIGTPREQVINYLIQIETQHMGMSEGRDVRKRAEAVVDAIIGNDAIWVWPDDSGRFS
jgi:hypothetical protein